MALHSLRNNFTGGEISPQLDARIDLQKYETSCRRLENFRVRPYGGVTFRSGTLYISEAKYPDKVSRQIPFIFSTSVSFVLELGDGYIRFFKDGARVETSPGTAYEIASDFAESELFAVQYKQINDVMYMVHPNHPVRKISRVADTNWTTENVAWTYPMLMDENADEAKTLTLDVGAGTLTAAGFTPFVAAHVGSYWELKNLRAATGATLDLSGSAGTANSTALSIVGEWQVITTERWYGTLLLQRSYDSGSTWTTIREWTSKSDRNVNISGNEASPGIGKPVPQLRLSYTAAGDPYGAGAWAGTAPTDYVKAGAKLEVADMYVTSLVVITGITSTTVADVDIFIEGTSGVATSVWSEGAWSTYRGYPRTIALFEQRLFFGGTATNPTTIWGSVTADFENFQKGDSDDAAVAYQMAAAQQNPIQWIETLLHLHAGTSGTEHIITGGSSLGEEPLTPSNVLVRDPTAYGSEAVQAVKVENAILFLQRQGRRIREMRDHNPVSQNNDNQAVDLTLLAEHLTDAGISQMAFGKVPDPTLYAVMGNGHLAVMAYNREQNVNGWSRYVTDGAFEGVACIPGSPADAVYVSVRRTINGVTKRYIEVFTAESSVGFQHVHMDSTVVYEGAETTTITGLGHLEGEEVAVVAGASGYVVGDQENDVDVLTVSGGQITLPLAATSVRVGLRYRGWIRPTSFETILSNGTSQGRQKRISKVSIHFKDTIGGYIGNNSVRDIPNASFATEIPFRSTEGNMDSAPDLFTGTIALPWPGGNETDDNMQISQLQPLPMTVLAIVAKMDVFGE